LIRNFSPTGRDAFGVKIALFNASWNYELLSWERADLLLFGGILPKQPGTLGPPNKNLLSSASSTRLVQILF
jgi:hypothetical protein